MLMAINTTKIVQITWKIFLDFIISCEKFPSRITNLGELRILDQVHRNSFKFVIRGDFIMVAIFKKKNNQAGAKKILLHVGGIFVVAVLAVLMVANVRMYQKRQEFVAQVASLETQINDIRQRNDNLKEGIANENNPAYIEKIARQELDLQRPGETTVSFIMPNSLDQKTTPNENVLQGWLGKSWEWVKSVF